MEQLVYELLLTNGYRLCFPGIIQPLNPVPRGNILDHIFRVCGVTGFQIAAFQNDFCHIISPVAFENGRHLPSEWYLAPASHL